MRLRGYTPSAVTRAPVGEQSGTLAATKTEDLSYPMGRRRQSKLQRHCDDGNRRRKR